jgi:DNA-binding MarR family transcriptional regulator
VNKGFVIRKACEEDKRSKNLYLTDKCNGYKEEIFYLLEKWIVSISNGIDRNALEFVIKELQHMAENAKVVDYDKLLEETH